MFPNVKYCYSLSITWISLARVEFPLPSALFMCLVFVCCAERHLPWTGISCVTTSPPIGDHHPLQYIPLRWRRTTTSTWRHNNKCLCFQFKAYNYDSILHIFYELSPPGLVWALRVAKRRVVSNLFRSKALERGTTFSGNLLRPRFGPSTAQSLYLDEQITRNKPRNSYPYVCVARCSVFVSSSCLPQ